MRVYMRGCLARTGHLFVFYFLADFGATRLPTAATVRAAVGDAVAGVGDPLGDEMTCFCNLSVSGSQPYS